MLPTFDLRSLSFYFCNHFFNLLGFEVICTFADDMENPKKQIPQAIVATGVSHCGHLYFFQPLELG